MGLGLWCLMPLTKIFQLYRGRDCIVVGFAKTTIFGNFQVSEVGGILKERPLKYRNN
jgi:hypothetical protein